MSTWLKQVFEEASEQLNRLPTWMHATDSDVPTEVDEPPNPADNPAEQKPDNE